MRINENDIKMLSFRKDLKHLLDKYGIEEFSGSVLDDGSIDVSLKNNKKGLNPYYKINNEKEIFREDYIEEITINVDELYKEYILSQFADIEYPEIPNNAIITNNIDKAEKVFEEILTKINKEDNLDRFAIKGCEKYIITKDDKSYHWYRASESMKGVRYNEAWIDLDIDYGMLRDVVIPSGKYSNRNKIHFI